MAIDERARRDLQRRLEEVLGDEHAMTLMEHLPGADVATKDDIGFLKRDLYALDQRMDALQERFDLKLEAQEHRLSATFRSELIAQTRTFVFATVTSLATIASLAFAAARLT